MIDLLALKRYEESHIAHLHPDSPTRKWWNALSFFEQCDISSGAAKAEDYRRDRKGSKLSGEEYGSNQ